MGLPSWLPIKWHYAASLAVLGCLLVVLVVACYTVSETSRLGNAIQAAIAVAAAATAVLALAVADRPSRRVQIDVRPPQGVGLKKRYYRDQIPPQHVGAFALYPHVFHSRRVYFTLINNSGFDLKSAVVTMEVPKSRRHPAKPPEDWFPSLNNTLMPMGPDHWVSEDDEWVIITGRTVYDWLDGHEREFYVRMTLDNDDLREFPIFIYVTCDNAQGFHQKEPMSPLVLMPSDVAVEP